MQTNLMYSLILQCFQFINNPVSGKIFLLFLVQNALESFEKCMSGNMLQGHCRQNFAKYKLHIVFCRTCQGIRRKGAIFLETEVRFVHWKYFSVLCREHAKKRA